MPALDLHPEYNNARYTMHGLFTDEQDALAKSDALGFQGLDVFTFKEQSPAGLTLFHVSARRKVEPVVRAGIPQQHGVDWEAVRMALTLFRSIMRKATGRAALRWYKQLEVEVLHRTIQGLDWSGSHLDVAAGMISDIILAHPFPNANHRTSLHMARKYLMACEIQWPGYNLQGRGHERLHRDTKEFFVESKYLLQLHRHPPMVHVAFEHGYDALRVGDNAEHSIRSPDFELDAEAIKQRHRAAARRMLREYVEPAHAERLNAARSKTLRQWIQTVGA